MAVIGTFTPAKDGGWIGRIHTLTISSRVRFVPNDNRDSDRAPAFRIFAGASELGAAWRDHTAEDSSRTYLRVRLDDPCLPEPLRAAMFEGAHGSEAHLIWSRPRMAK